MLEEAFRLNVKWSLQELSKAINGDGKTSPNPLFRVKVVLEGDKVLSSFIKLAWKSLTFIASALPFVIPSLFLDV